MHEAVERLKSATAGSEYEGRLWLVGGCVRDELLGLLDSPDIDLVLEGDALKLARWLYGRGASSIAPELFGRFGTALVRVSGAQIELAAARRESYQTDSRKPEVQQATLEEDAKRRDFTINSIYKNLHTSEIFDPNGGQADLQAKTLQTPVEPAATFKDDPLRMLRAVRFRWRFDLTYAPGLEDAIRVQAERLDIVSAERIQEELTKMLQGSNPADAMRDLQSLGLLQRFWPEFSELVGCEQGEQHHLDVWEHTLLTIENAAQGSLDLKLAALFHDVAKPRCKQIRKGRITFLGHDELGAEMTREMLARLRFSEERTKRIARIVKNHMRHPGSPPTDRAARRLKRDMGRDLGLLLELMGADRAAHAATYRDTFLPELIQKLNERPAEKIESPLSGGEVMELLGIAPGPEVGEALEWLTERVIDGDIPAGDKQAARTALRNRPNT